MNEAIKRKPLKAILTPREEEVLKHVADGLSNKEIGIQLGITYCTVRNHLHNIFSKLGASNRTEAVIWTLKHESEKR